jgi:hypothetical protein
MLKIIDGDKFYSHEIDNNKEMQQKILQLSDDIQKYFNVSNWSSFKKSIKLDDCTRTISIIKSVLKMMGIKFQSKTYAYKLKVGYIHTTEYDIIRK